MSPHFIKGPLVQRGPATGQQHPGVVAYARDALRNGFKSQGQPLARKEGKKILLHTPSGQLAASVPAEAVGDLAWVVEVDIGTPSVTVKLDLDTGSSDMWVTEKERVELVNGQIIAKEPYDPKLSSTVTHIPGSFDISYEDGSGASGKLYKDVVSIAGITIPDQAFGRASKEKGNSDFADGLLGLGFPENVTSDPPQKTLMQNLVDEKIITFPYFTVFLGKEGEESFYTFGWPDFASAGIQDPTVLWAHVDKSDTDWKFDFKTVVVNGNAMNIPNGKALLDTGTTLTILSEPVVKHIYSQIPGWKKNQVGHYLYPKGSKVPHIQLAVGDHLRTFHPENLVHQEEPDGYIFGSIQPGPEDDMIFGDSFLRNVYAVFDVTKKLIGVAQKGSV